MTARAFVSLRCPRGETVDLVPGDVIGRTDRAALLVDDPRVSEAHAFVSLRHGRLFMLSLRRMVAVNGKPHSEVALAPAMSIELAPGLAVDVLAVSVPERLRTLVAPGRPAHVLGPVTSVSPGPPLRITSRFDPASALHLWFVGTTLKGWLHGTPVGELSVGDSVAVGGVELRLDTIEIDTGNTPNTDIDGSLLAPIELVGRYDSIEIRRRNEPTVTFGGVGARILNELISLGQPASWRAVAAEVWPTPATEVELRHKWDSGLSRLRRKLRGFGIRGDLISADGSGCVQLCLQPGDSAHDGG